MGKLLKVAGGLLLASLFVIGSVVAALVADLRLYAGEPASFEKSEVIVNGPPGLGMKAIARNLQNAGVIRQPLKFEWLARIRETDKQIKAGEYLLSPNMTPLAVLDTLVAGRAILYRLTVPEGLTVEETAGRVEMAGLGSREAFFATATDPATAAVFNLPADTLEGYLYPDTYHFPGTATPMGICRAMVGRFREVFTPRWEARAAEMGFTVHEIVTLASIIEKETAVVEERPLIASVFHNRLKRHMRLETDPTVIYGIRNFDGNLTKQDLSRPTPYNTYRIHGLPPGPIAGPGLASLQAALYPADTAYLYFVSRNDGSHQFSTNLKDHNLAVRKYQLGR